MTGVSIRISSAQFAPANTLASLMLPDISGLTEEYVFGVNQASSIRNRANPVAPLTVIGAPTYSAYDTYVTGGGYGNNGFDTSVSPDTDVTMLAVVKAAATGTLDAFTAYTGGTSILGFSLDSTVRFANSQWASSPDLATITTPNHGNYFVIAGVGALGQAPKLYVAGAGALSSNTGTGSGQNPRYTSSSHTLHVGASASTGQGSVAAAFLFNRTMTQAQVLAAYLSLKSFYNGKITVA